MKINQQHGLPYAHDWVYNNLKGPTTSNNFDDPNSAASVLVGWNPYGTSSSTATRPAKQVRSCNSSSSSNSITSCLKGPTRHFLCIQFRSLNYRWPIPTLLSENKKIVLTYYN